MEIYLDIGNDGLIKEFILDMIEKIWVMGLIVKIKLDVYVVFSYVNWYMKWFFCMCMIVIYF